MTRERYRQFVDERAKAGDVQRQGRTRLLVPSMMNVMGMPLRTVTVRVRRTRNGLQYRELGGAWSRLQPKVQTMREMVRDLTGY